MEIKVLNSLARVFPGELCGSEATKLSCLKNERAAFQIAVKCDEDSQATAEVNSLREYISAYYVKDVPVGFVSLEDRDDFYLNGGKPGMYPDILMPLEGSVSAEKEKWISFWFEVDLKGQLETGTHNIKISISDGKKRETVTLPLVVHSASLPEQTLVCTHWFHTDCLASYYKAEVFSEEHWSIIEKFMRDFVKHGNNLLLTPLFTPPLDTEVGGERPTVQLVDVKKEGDTYSFGFEKLSRWIDLALSCGVKYFEMSHLFTQWGALAAPKIMAETATGYEKIFGWDTDAAGEEYGSFLRRLAPELIKFLKEKGVADRVMFHTSDEPELKDYDSYKKAADLTKELFGDFKIIDALSEYRFYEDGIIKHPITNIDRIDRFLGRVPGLWTYYCCNPYKENMPNRFLTMPAIRNRIMGFLMYKYDVVGFLHWGYNFYYTQYSKREVDPFNETDAGGNFPAGDSFIVYPGKGGEPYDSMRIKVFYEAIQDYEALRALEKKIGRNAVLTLLEEGLTKPLSNRDYPHSDEWLLKKREEINSALSGDSVKFTKMHGAGNDYIYVNCFKENIRDRSKTAIKVSDRHFGIGADGLICIDPSQVADCKMDMYNADGSQGKMCGNGVRCVAKYAYDNGIASKEEITVETLSGIKKIKVFVKDDKVYQATVNMGEPIFEPRLIPALFEGESAVNVPMSVGGSEYKVTLVSMGNPHCVVFTDEVASFPLDKIGPLFENNEKFPERINTEFVRVIDSTTLEMRVWERGSGETLACGTGTCAVIAAAVLSGYCEKDALVTVRLLGGELKIKWDSGDNCIYMTGPAATVCTGEFKQ